MKVLRLKPGVLLNVLENIRPILSGQMVRQLFCMPVQFLRIGLTVLRLTVSILLGLYKKNAIQVI